jgi:hypothetical protein
MKDQIILFYGMKLLIPVNPIEYMLGGIGISSSNSEKVRMTFIVSKYFADDTDANRYKVRCVPLLPATPDRILGIETFYSSDLKILIREGSIKVVE